jgi:hypothetical protein
MSLSRRSFLAHAVLAAAGATLPRALTGAAPLMPSADDRARLAEWLRLLCGEGLCRRGAPFGPAVARAAELMLGLPYAAYTLEQYLADGGTPGHEPLTLHLSKFDCVSLVESAIAVARTAAAGPGQGWNRFAAEVERMRYRGGQRRGYASRIHYFSEWIADGERRGLVRDLGPELGGVRDERPLRFMTGHRASYPALRDDVAFAAIAERERALDAVPRWLVPADRIAAAQSRIQSGDVLAFATAIPGLDVTHTGLAYRDGAGVLRVLHAPLSGGAVEVSRTTLAGYVAAIRRATGILVARPLRR